MSVELISIETQKALFWQHWKLKGTTATAFEALWPHPSHFLRDWDKPLAELKPKENRVDEAIMVDVIAGLVVDICDAGEKLDLPVETPPANELVSRLEAILDRSRGRVPAIKYAKLFRLLEWLTRPSPGAAEAIAGAPPSRMATEGRTAASWPRASIEPGWRDGPVASDGDGAAATIERPDPPALAMSRTIKRKRRQFYGWLAGGEYRVSLVPPDGPVRPSVAFESRKEAEQWADRKRGEVYWYPPLVGQ
jgi:hypothetical protein